MDRGELPRARQATLFIGKMTPLPIHFPSEGTLLFKEKGENQQLLHTLKAFKTNMLHIKNKSKGSRNHLKAL